MKIQLTLIALVVLVLFQGCPEPVEPQFCISINGNEKYIGKTTVQNIARFDGKQWYSVVNPGIDPAMNTEGSIDEYSMLADSIAHCIYLCDSRKNKMWRYDLAAQQWTLIISGAASKNGQASLDLSGEAGGGGVTHAGVLYLGGSFDTLYTNYGILVTSGVVCYDGTGFTTLSDSIRGDVGSLYTAGDYLYIRGLHDASKFLNKLVCKYSFSLKKYEYVSEYGNADVAPYPEARSWSGAPTYMNCFDSVSGKQWVAQMDDKLRPMRFVIPNPDVRVDMSAVRWAAGEDYIVFSSSKPFGNNTRGTYCYVISTNSLILVDNSLAHFVCDRTTFTYTSNTADDVSGMGNLFEYDPFTNRKTSLKGGVFGYNPAVAGCQWCQISDMAKIDNNLFVIGHFSSAGK